MELIGFCMFCCSLSQICALKIRFAIWENVLESFMIWILDVRYKIAVTNLFFQSFWLLEPGKDGNLRCDFDSLLSLGFDIYVLPCKSTWKVIFFWIIYIYLVTSAKISLGFLQYSCSCKWCWLNLGWHIVRENDYMMQLNIVKWLFVYYSLQDVKVQVLGTNYFQYFSRAGLFFFLISNNLLLYLNRDLGSENLM